MSKGSKPRATDTVNHSRKPMDFPGPVTYTEILTAVIAQLELLSHWGEFLSGMKSRTAKNCKQEGSLPELR
jgi:hypothetical protein